jgi:hypothetical protein
MRGGVSSLEGLGSGSTIMRGTRYKPDVQMGRKISLDRVTFLLGSPSELRVNKWGSDLCSGGLAFLRQDRQTGPAPSPVKWLEIHDS